MVDLAGIFKDTKSISRDGYAISEPASFKGVFIGPNVTTMECVLKSKSRDICKRSPCASAKLYMVGLKDGFRTRGRRFWVTNKPCPRWSYLRQYMFENSERNNALLKFVVLCPLHAPDEQ